MSIHYDFIKCCNKGQILKAKHIMQKKTSYNKLVIENNVLNEAFGICCKKGHIDMAKWLYDVSLSKPETRIDININSEFAFRVSCKYGHKEIAEWLYNLSKINGNTKIDIHKRSNYAFKKSCENGHKEIAEWLYNLSQIDGNTKINIRENSDEMFKISCSNGHKEIAIWLASLCSDYELKIENNKIVSFVVSKLKDKIKNKTINEIVHILKITTSKIQEPTDDCCYLCLDEKPDLKYGCNHLMCLNCMIKWNIYDDHKICDICKKPIEYNKMTLFI